RLGAVEDANRRLERSILAYQDETKQMTALLDQLKSDIRMAASGGQEVSLPLRERLQSMLANEAEVQFDAESLTISMPSSRLFDLQSGRMTAEAERWLDAIGKAVRDEAATDRTHEYVTEISGSIAASPVRQATGEDGDESP